MEDYTTYKTDSKMRSAMKAAGREETLRRWIVGKCKMGKVNYACDTEHAMEYLNNPFNAAKITTAIYKFLNSFSSIFSRTTELFIEYLAECPRSGDWPVLALLIRTRKPGIGYDLGKYWERAVVRKIEKYPQWNHLAKGIYGASSGSSIEEGIAHTPVAAAADRKFLVLLAYLMCQVTPDVEIYRDDSVSFRFSSIVLMAASAFLNDATMPPMVRMNHPSRSSHSASLTYIITKWLEHSEAYGWEVSSKFYTSPRDFRHELRYMALTGDGFFHVFEWLDAHTRSIPMLHGVPGTVLAEDFWLPREDHARGLQGNRRPPLSDVPRTMQLVLAVAHVLENDIDVRLLFGTHHKDLTVERSPIAWVEWSPVSEKEDDLSRAGTVFTSFLEAMNEVVDTASLVSAETWKILVDELFALDIPTDVRIQGLAVDPAAAQGAGCVSYVYARFFGYLMTLSKNHVFVIDIFPVMDEAVSSKLPLWLRKNAVDIINLYNRRSSRTVDIADHWLVGMEHE